MEPMETIVQKSVTVWAEYTVIAIPVLANLPVNTLVGKVMLAIKVRAIIVL